MAQLPVPAPKPPRFSPKRLLTAFLTGLAFLAPLLLTAIVLIWVFQQLVGFVGPESWVGQLLTAGGRLVIGDGDDPLLGFLLGLGLLVGLITALGFAVKDRARRVLEDLIDEALGRIPLLGNIYRPVAQLVRGMAGSKAEEMSAMAVVRVELGAGIESIGLLASNETLDLGGGPRKLVLLTTAPVPVGGALLLVPVERVHLVPEMRFEDVMKLYLTMGMSPPESLRVAAARERQGAV
jgi:uncharacterized membrane protein